MEDNNSNQGSHKKVLSVQEIRQDKELVRLNKLLYKTLAKSRARLDHLYKENNITPVEFVSGLGFLSTDDNCTSRVND